MHIWRLKDKNSNKNLTKKITQKQQIDKPSTSTNTPQQTTLYSLSWYTHQRPLNENTDP